MKSTHIRAMSIVVGEVKAKKTLVIDEGTKITNDPVVWVDLKADVGVAFEAKKEGESSFHP